MMDEDDNHPFEAIAITIDFDNHLRGEIDQEIAEIRFV